MGMPGLTSALLFTEHVTTADATTGKEGVTMTRSTTDPPLSLVGD